MAYSCEGIAIHGKLVWTLILWPPCLKKLAPRLTLALFSIPEVTHPSWHMAKGIAIHGKLAWMRERERERFSEGQKKALQHLRSGGKCNIICLHTHLSHLLAFKKVVGNFNPTFSTYPFVLSTTPYR